LGGGAAAPKGLLHFFVYNNKYSGAGAPAKENCIFNWILATLFLSVWHQQLSTDILPSQA
jgi:hypothetical protein